jgi:hypothetical protein
VHEVVGELVEDSCKWALRRCCIKMSSVLPCFTTTHQHCYMAALSYGFLRLLSAAAHAATAARCCCCSQVPLGG